MAAKNLASQFADDIISHSVDLMRFDASVRKRLLGTLNSLQQELVAKITKMGGFDGLSARQKATRLANLLKQTQETIRTSYKGIRNDHMSEMLPLAKLEAQFVSTMFKDQFSVNVLNSRLTVEKLRAIAKGSAVRGAPSQTWWGRQAADLRDNFADQMNLGYLQDETVDDLVQRVRGKYTGQSTELEVDGEMTKVKQFAGGIMDVSTRNAEALVRTSVQNLANDVRLQTYEANTDIIKAVQALATLDTRTTLLCISRDKKVWEQDEDGEWSPADGNDIDWPGPPPWHWNCRTTLVPILYSWAELSAQADSSKSAQKLAAKVDRNTDEGFRASMDGDVAQETDYPEWLDNQSVERQKEVLGPGRYSLWEGGGGKVPLDKMVDQRGNELTLAQLQAKYH